jgi:hypothetical protein
VHAARKGKKKNAYRILMGKPEGKRPLGRSILRLVDNIKMDFSVMEWSGMDLIDLAKNRDLWRAILYKVINLKKKLTKLSDRSPQANYTDRATAACRRSCQSMRVDGVAWSAQRIPTAVNLGFLDRGR